MAKLEGLTGNATFGGTDLLIKKWSGDFKRDFEDTTVQGGDGWRAGQLAGKKEFDVNFDFQLDDSVIGSGSEIFPFNSSGSVVLNMAGGVSLTFNAVCNEYKINKDEKGLVTGSAKAMSTGAVTFANS